MDIKKLHEPYKDQNSPSPELQLRWLKRLGYEPHVIDQAMLTVYTEIEQGRTFKDGAELNFYLKTTAERARQAELSAYVVNLERFEAKLKAKWEAERLKREEEAAAAAAREKALAEKPGTKAPWYKRIFSSSKAGE